jgi:hypothetical protein
MAKAKPGARRSVDTSAVLADQPWYVRTVVYVGLPTVVAGYLLYFVVGQLSQRLDSLSSTLTTHQTDMRGLMTHLEQEAEQSWAMVGSLSRICLNTSKTDADRLSCVSVPRRRE